jgi:intracellular sulfur oxidation DsrE/DsrF family protein
MLIRTLLGSFALAALAVSSPAYAQSQLSEPAPTVDNPRRIMLQLTSDDAKVMNLVLNNAINLQKFYGQDRVQVVVIAFGPGMEALYKKSSPVADRVSSLAHYDVSFIGCANTMESTHHTPDELVEGVQVVPAGVAEIVERQLRGWSYVRP